VWSLLLVELLVSLLESEIMKGEWRGWWPYVLLIKKTSRSYAYISIFLMSLFVYVPSA
jgi:hypothetical protein